MTELVHGRVRLALHRLSAGEGRPLLLLHSLYSASSAWDRPALVWPGPVFALDFAGHGASAWVRGGAYCSELLVGDADIALAEIGEAALLGSGFGAYVALLLAGARPDSVTAALLWPGSGLEGAGAAPTESDPPGRHPTLGNVPGDAGCDPHVEILAREFRPPEYARAFAKKARALLLAEEGRDRPLWWTSVRDGANASVVAPEWGTALRELAARSN